MSADVAGRDGGMEWLANTGHGHAANERPDHDGGEIAIFLQDVAPELAAEALARGRDQSTTPMLEPWPLDRWPELPTRYLLCRAS